MPVYVLKCHCGHREDMYRSVEARNRRIPKHCGRRMSRVITAPHVIEDMKPYLSPIDGKPVKSRSEHRNHMHKHGVVELGNERIKKKEKEMPPVEQDLYDAFTRSGL